MAQYIERGAIQRRSGMLSAMSPKRLIALIGGLALAVVLVVGVVQLARSPTPSETPAAQRLTPAQMQARLVGSPAPLAALHAQADELLGGGARALRARLAALKGWPVVLDKWASWCEQCKAEFGVFQRTATNLGRKVAFIGIDSGDTSRAKPLEFLDSFPVSYPSYFDPSTQIGVEVSDSTLVPATIFYNRRGERNYIRQGAYPSVATLERDVERYAEVG
ncbi:MAG TPA: TlpA disulfide reductase family protein [Solirubrobacteraceae bacterium]|nr:TlpA disulfide reductase family protein [Solirubrobacteraceae bacterium]